MKIAIDFDGVIARRNGIPTKKEKTEDLIPIEGAKETIEMLLKNGHEVYVFTSHEPINEIDEWLEIYDFPHGFIVTNIKQVGTQVYIDDRAIRFTSWQDTRKYFS